MRGRRDWLLVAALFAFAALVFVCAYVFYGRANVQAHIDVYINGSLFESHPYGKEVRVPIAQQGEKLNVLVVEKDGFFVESATCRDQLCVKQGKVSMENYRFRALGASVYCLPNGLEIRLREAGDEKALPTPRLTPEQGE